VKVACTDIMRKIDSYCVESLKLPGIILMENAALKVIKNIDLNKFNNFIIVCGKGNNGGDGFAVARHLFLLGKKIDVFLVGSEEGMSEDCRVNYRILRNMGIKVDRINNVEDISELRDNIIKSDLTVDAVFGTGLTRNVEGIYDTVITVINENSAEILSIDVPSGFDSDNGKNLGNCIRASLTVSFQLYKRGFLNYGTDKYTGKVIVEDIGIPDAVVDKFHNNEFIMDEGMIKESLHIRDKYSHKGDYGKVLVIAGSKGFTGAAYISTQGAVRSGAGLVTLCCHKDIVDILTSKLVEAMTITFGDGDKLIEHIEKSDAIAIGPGMGNNETTLEMVKLVLREASCPIVIDADAINVLKDNVSLLKERKNSIILTPHVGEMARITGLSIDYITENRIEVAKKFALENSVIVLLKGYNTIITDGETTVINPTGNSSMASGGMGDCLTGIITSLVGQGYDSMAAAYAAAYIHGYCGERLSRRMFCVSASSILEEIPTAIKELQK
jgi:ADP-dependent NAD(P)H-hydrate dehydratase / NAD(P)H-hydrate epimerase